MDQRTKIIVIIVAIVAIIWIFNDSAQIGALNTKISDLEDDLSYSEQLVSDYQDALTDANYNIEEANRSIEDAQYYAWSSYDDMGYALEALTTVYTVDEP